MVADDAGECPQGLGQPWGRSAEALGGALARGGAYCGVLSPTSAPSGSQRCVAHPCTHSVLLSPGDCQSTGQTQAMAGS